MGGRGSTGTAPHSRVARSAAKIEKQITTATNPTEASTHVAGLPLTDKSGGVLNPTDVLSKTALDNLDSRLIHELSAWGNSLTSQERDAISAWNTNTVYKKLNEVMKTGSEPDAYLKGVIDKLNSAIQKSTVPENLTVYRGVKRNTSIEAAQKMIGTDFFNRNMFTATSASYERAAHFSGNPKYGGNTSEGTIFKITIPKGAKGAYLNASKAGVVQEHELLLSPNAHYTVTGYERVHVKPGKDYYGSSIHEKTLTVLHMVYTGG